MKTRLTGLIILTIVCIVFQTASARTLIGENYTAVTYSQLDFGDGPKGFLDNGHGGSVTLNLNDDSENDFQFGVDYTTAEGVRLNQDVEISTFGFRADFVQRLNDSERAKPYFNIGLRVLDIDVTGPGLEADDTDVGLGIGLGIELELTPFLSARFSANHDNVGGDHNFFAAQLGWWITEHLVGTVSYARETDADANIITAGGAILFK